MLRFYFLAIIVCSVDGATLLEWFWKKSDENPVVVADGVPLVSIPYESMTDDEKFLQEAAKFTEIQVASPLETCQHKVIMQIRTSCVSMTEENLAKLSVNLLNCQSAVEGRKMFPCTEDMSLKQCTTDMDADTWNAYHLISNRARAVCYAARNTQFRALTEITVNKLMQSARAQIETLGSLKESQERLEDKTAEALTSLSTRNEALLQQQEDIRQAQASAYKLVSMNLKELRNEKALLRIGHTQLASMTEEIKQKLEKASMDLEKQAEERSVNHKELLEDLTNLQMQAQLIWDKIESTTERLVAQNEAAAEQFEQTLQRLSEISNTLEFIWNMTSAMRDEMDKKLGWITNYIGDTGEQVQRVYLTALHIVYLFSAMIVAAFLQAPILTRTIILGVVPLNLVTYLKHGAEACLDFTSITALILLITGMNYVMIGIQYCFGPRQHATRYQNGRVTGGMNGQASRIPERTTAFYRRVALTLRDCSLAISRRIAEFFNKISTTAQSVASLGRRGIVREELSCSYVHSRRLRDEVVGDPRLNVSDDLSDGEDEYNLPEVAELRRRFVEPDSSHDRSSRSLTPNQERVFCNMITRNGGRCRNRPIFGNSVCGSHVRGSSYRDT